MTYALSWPLQAGLYKAVCESPDCNQHLEGRVFDAAPPNQGQTLLDEIYVTFGDEDVTDWSSSTTIGAVHTITVSVFAPRRGFAGAKQAAAAVSDAILTGDITLARGTVVNAQFIDAKTRREDGDTLRRIDLRFRITVQDGA